MIAIIKGQVVSKDTQSLIVQVGGFGLRVQTPAQTLAQATPGEKILLHTTLFPRKDALLLFGFETIEERDLFNQLISVSGVGPRIAMSMLSTLSVTRIYQAVLKEQAEIYSQVPGIGIKTARKLVLFLKDKLSPMAEVLGIGVEADVNSEVIDALTNLGYSSNDAQKALQSIPKDTPDDLETRLRIALNYFSV